MKLPIQLHAGHHLLFTFYHISCDVQKAAKTSRTSTRLPPVETAGWKQVYVYTCWMLLSNQIFEQHKVEWGGGDNGVWQWVARGNHPTRFPRRSSIWSSGSCCSYLSGDCKLLFVSLYISIFFLVQWATHGYLLWTATEGTCTQNYY